MAVLLNLEVTTSSPLNKKNGRKRLKNNCYIELIYAFMQLGKLVFGKKRSDKSLSKIPIEIRVQRGPNTYSKKNKDSNNNFS